MPLQNQPTMNRLRDYAALFSRQTANEVLSGEMDRVEQKIKRYDQEWIESNPKTYHAYFKRAYKYLKKSYQNEYILKNELLNRWLKEHLGSTDSELYSEFRVGTAKADLVMFNGSAKAFEIKSEYDSPSRLSNQLRNYTKAFHEIYLIVPEKHVSKYSAIIDETIGLISYNGKEFNQIRKSAKRQSLCRKTAMSILHTKEYKQIVKDYNGVLPEMTSFTQYDICFDKINEIEEKKFTEIYLTTLKKRVRRPNLSTRYFSEFNQLVLAMNWDDEQRHAYINQLKKTIN
jgi:hypothetical protein